LDCAFTMLEGVVSKLLCGYLGRYVNGLESQNLQLSLSTGIVTLENLELKVFHSTSF
jgi:hypothetical protein